MSVMTFRKDAPRSWLYLTATVFMMLTVQGLSDIIGVIVAIFIEHFKETNARAGWVGSIIAFLLLALCPLVIYTYQRFGFRWCMAISCSFYVLSFLVTPFVPSLNFVFFTYSIPFGIALSFIANLSVRTQRQYFDKYYGFAVGVRYSGNALGAVLLSFVFPIIYVNLGFKNTFLTPLVFAPLFFIYGLVSRTRCADTRIQTHSRDVAKKSRLYSEFVQDKSFAFCLAGTTIFFVVCLIPIIFMVRYGVTLGYPLSKAKWLLVMRNASTIPARLIAGRVSDVAFRRGKVKLIVQITYLVFGLSGFLCSFVQSFPLLMLYMGFNGIVEGVFWVTLPLYVDEITAGYHSDEAFGLMLLLGAFSTLVGPPALGWLFDKTGDFRYVFYAIFVMASLASFLVALSSCVGVKKQLSLAERSKTSKMFSDSCESINISGGKIAESTLVYETAV